MLRGLIPGGGNRPFLNFGKLSAIVVLRNICDFAGYEDMLFSSIRYVVFLTVNVLLYYMLPYRHRPYLLLASSIYFYAAWDPFSVLWLLAVTAISYSAGRSLSRCHSPLKRKKITVLSAGCILFILFVFKYLDFLLLQVIHAAGAFGLHLSSGTGTGFLSVAAPIGISFYSFQALGYIFDVSGGKTEASRDPVRYALSIAFFVHILQGPIDRSGLLLPQLDERHDFEYDSFCHGLAIFLFGAFKKVVIADRLAILVNTVYGNVNDYRGQAFWIASVFYTFQIYCDFSGYTDMALGSAELMGFRLSENFRRPYLATSVTDFWRRWHISLSRWFRDYVYIPLGGSRCSERRRDLNVMIVFLISGLWHGAAWAFIIWGLLHGLCQVIGRYKARLSSRIFPDEHMWLRCFRTAVTFLIVNLLWIPFRVNSFRDLSVIFGRLFALTPGFRIDSLGMVKEDFFLSLLLILFVILTDVISETKGGYNTLMKLPVFLRRSLYMLCIFVIILFGVYGSLSAESFIYFTF